MKSNVLLLAVCLAWMAPSLAEDNAGQSSGVEQFPLLVPHASHGGPDEQ